MTINFKKAGVLFASLLLGEIAVLKAAGIHAWSGINFDVQLAMLGAFAAWIMSAASGTITAIGPVQNILKQWQDGVKISALSFRKAPAPPEDKK